MTTEVVLMNAAAVALAADSAVTVSSGAGSKVYNTANKVFALSKYAPVGIMIYNAADFLGIPWETIIKDYRSRLGTKRFPTLTEYYTNFLDYLKSNQRFFNKETKDFHLSTAIYILIEEIIQDAQKRPLASSDCTDQQTSDNKAVTIDQINQSIDHFINEISKLPYLDSFEVNDGLAIEEQVYGIVRWWLPYFYEKKFVNQPDINIEILTAKLTDLLVLCLTREVLSPSFSGLVITGFGEDEALPSLECCSIDGFAGQKIRVKRSEKKSIRYDNRSEIIPFAQTQMIDSILQGALPGYTEKLLSIVKTAIKNLPITIISNIKELSDEQKQGYTALYSNMSDYLLDANRWVDNVASSLSNTKRDAVAMLPKAELAIAAETFIHVAQLEHRLSLNAETVGGPIDVAIITKGDGLVWIKRKHYFDAALNRGFIENYYNKDYIYSESEE